MQRFRDIATNVIIGLWLVSLAGAALAQDERPNILIVFTDDQGYGDLSCYGSKSIQTPRIDQLASEGTRFTSFYAQIVCGPSRSALLTGRYPARSLGWSMPADEITVAELLQDAGYATGCIGKWDVSNRAAIIDRMPNAQGFAYYFGTLGANDNGAVSFHENNTPAGSTDDMASLTGLYTDKAIEFLRSHREEPFFLYVAHTMVHSVIDASPEFRGTSKGGLYGDCVQELDHHTGRLLDALDELELSQKTLVIFTTDNGAWNNFQDVLSKRHNGQVAWGSSGPLREGKGSTYEGGLRVPCIVRWPGHVPAGRTSDAIFATIDFLPTFGRLAGFDVPTDRIIDGVDQTDLLTAQSESGNRDNYLYFCRGELHAVRRGPWKLILPDRRQFYGYVKDKGTQQVELYNLTDDIAESGNLAAGEPERVREMLAWSGSLNLPDAPYDARIGLNAPAPAAGARRETALPAGDWEAHGLTAPQRDRIVTAFESGIRQNVIPGGTLMIIHRGEVILNEGFGVADLESQLPWAASAPCHIASLTKPHTATLLAKLADEGRLSLDVPIDTWLPEFAGLQVRVSAAGVEPVSAAPTLRQCLSHTAGFPGNNAIKSGRFDLRLDGNLSEVAARLSQRPLMAQPGERYAYSRLGYIVAGRVAEVVCGRPFPQLMQTMLFDPLGARTAGFTLTDRVREALPVAYVRDNEAFQPRARPESAAGINPGGGMIASADDVARLLLLHRNRGRLGDRQFISAAALDEMYVAQPATPGTGYGLGFNIMQRRTDGSPVRIRHTGASGTLGVIDFDRDLIVIVLTQLPQTQTEAWRGRLVRTINDVFPLVSETQHN